MPTAHQIAVAAEIAARIAPLRNGERGRVVAEAAAELGVSVQTLYAWIRLHTGRTRKVRSDARSVRVARRNQIARDDTPDQAALEAAEAGLSDLSLPEAEARLIGATCMESGRANGKQLLSLKRAVDTLRRQGLIRAERIDRTTGEAKPLSLSAISRALRAWCCHPEQLTAPTPHTAMRTSYPNQRWEVDASVCVVYYLPGGGAVVQDIEAGVHYKNKPQNLEAIAEHRVIRYVLTDHCSGVARWRYYPGSETGAHTVAFLCWCMAPKTDRADPFNGAPWTLVADPGATSAGTVRRFCALAQIDLHITRVHNSRGKGSVEKAQDLVERAFESGLRFQRHRVTDFDSLNKLAERFQLHWNATEIHTRHGMSRFDAWQRIPAEKLRITESEQVLRTLATEAPRTPKVGGDLCVSYRGATWDCRDVPGIHVGQRLPVLWSPLLGPDGQGRAVAVLIDPKTERETYRPLPQVQIDEWGFRADAPEAGAEYARPADTDVDLARKRLSRLASGTDTQRDDELARRRKDFRPLADLDDGRGVDPYRDAETADPRTYLPRRGIEHRVAALPEVQAVALDHTEAALRLGALVRRRGGDWGPERYQWLVQRYPDGVPEDAIAAIADEILTTRHAVPAAAGLRVIK